MSHMVDHSMLTKTGWQYARFAAPLAGLVATKHACDCGCALTVAMVSSTFADTLEHTPLPAMNTIIHALSA